MSTIGERIKTVRTQMKLIQSDFGESLGVSNAHISKVEKEESGVSDTLIRLIACTYGVRYQWLLDGSGDMMEPKSAKPELMAPQAPAQPDSITSCIVINVKISDLSLTLKELRHLIAELVKDVETSSDE